MNQAELVQIGARALRHASFGGAAMRILSFALAVTIAATAQGASAQPVTFQGLNGDSTRQQVLARFPSASVTRPLCKPGEISSHSADGVFACDFLRVARYEVGDTPFELTFAFTTEGKLWQVWLSYSWPAEKTLQPNWSQIVSKYSNVKSLLIEKYGQPLDTACIELGGPSDRNFNLCSTWQGNPARRYDPSQGTIELTADGFKHDKTDDTYLFSTVSVVYRLISRKDADRL